MPVTNNYEIQEYQGNSSGRTFNFPFRCFSLDHLKVELIDSEGNASELVQNTDYKITGGIDNSGGMITYPLDASLPALSVSETIRIYRATPMEQSVDYPTYQQAIENALDKVTMLLQEAVNDSAVNIANEAREKVDIIVAGANSKADINGGNIDRLSFLSALGVSSNGEVDLADVAYTDASNASPEGYRNLVGMPEVESNVSELSVSTAKTDGSNITVEEWRSLLGVKDTLPIAPQTIVKGAVGDIPSGWQEGWCDKPAQHLEVSTAGSATLIVKAGLQVAAGVDGRVLLSDELASDSSLSMTSGSDGTHYVYADVGTSGSMSFGSTDVEPQVGLEHWMRFEPQIPSMTGATTDGYIADANTYSGLGYPWRALDGSLGEAGNYWHSSGVLPAWLSIQLPTMKKVAKYSLAKIREALAAGARSWEFQGSIDGVAWKTLDTQTDVGTDYTYTEFEVPVPAYYKYHRMYITEQNGSNAAIYALQLYTHEGFGADFYNTADQTHYASDGNSISRVYIGECVISSGAIVDVISYQHGTTVTMPVNGGANIAVNSTYNIDRPYLGYCTSQARIYHESKWGKTGFITNTGGNGSGTRSNYTDGVLSVVAGNAGVTYAGGFRCGSEFSSGATSAPAKVTVERSW